VEQTKKCTQCGEVKGLSEYVFKVKAKNIYQSQCNSCRRVMNMRSYYKFREKNVARAVKNNKKISDWFNNIKSKLSCCVCGENDPACLDFHHIEPSEKDFALSEQKRNSKKKLLNEMNKCACLCANCHRKLHAGSINPPLVKLDIT
jgi:hypothetical protein